MYHRIPANHPTGGYSLKTAANNEKSNLERWQFLGGDALPAWAANDLTATYVVSGWDCSNPMHVTAFARERLCNQSPLNGEQSLGTDFTVLQHVMVKETKRYACRLEIS